jgi:hypothetical protein
MNTPRRRRAPTLFVLLLVSSALLVLATYWWTTGQVTSSVRVTPVYDPPVLAGQMAWPGCSGGVYARTADSIVLTSSGHCAPEGDIAHDPDGKGVAGVWGPIDHSASCPYAGHICEASDMNYLIVAADRIPWGHLNEIDMGAGGYRVVAPGTRPLGCEEIQVNDPVEIDGRGVYRKGHVLEKGEYLKPADRDPFYFACIVAADIQVATGDSGGVVLVRGVPTGVVARRFGDLLGFTPLGTGLAELDLTMCDSPNCGLTSPPP